MPFESSTITLPAAWASALVNGDYSGLDEAESFRCREALHALECDGYDIVSCNEETQQFTWQFHLYDENADCLGGDVVDYVIIRPVR